MEHFEVAGVRLAVAVSGVPEAMPLVLLHGGGGDRSVWDAVAPTLAHTHRVHALDQRGFGDSDRPGRYSFADMRDDVFGLLDRIGAAQVDIIGHSMGGTVAWLVAQEQPERVRRLVIVDSPPPKPGMHRIMLGPRPDPEPPYDWAAVEAVVHEVNNADPQWWERIGSVTARTLLLAGGPPSHVPQDLFPEALALLKDGTLLEIPMGHHIHRDAPAEFLAAVVPFLNS